MERPQRLAWNDTDHEGLAVVPDDAMAPNGDVLQA
jgi:hypothetical protein